MELSEVGDKILEDQKIIMEKWQAVAKESLKAAPKIPDDVLRDHLTQYLDSLAMKLKGEEAKESKLRQIFAQEHGKSRAFTSHYTVDQVISEFQLLEDVSLDYLRENKLMEPEIIVKVIETTKEMTRCAATQYSDSLLDAQRKIFSTLTHDIRNPLTASSLQAELLLEEEGLASEIRAGLETILNNVEKADHYIIELLNSLKGQAGGRMVFNAKEISLKEALWRSVEGLNKVYRNISCEFEDSSFKGCYDPTAIERMIENLVLNAEKFKTPSSDVKVSLKKDGGFAVISVHNFGEPISPDKQRKIFEFLNKGEESFAKQGWGIGLSVVSAVAKAHGGRVEVESDKERGTNLKVFLRELPSDLIER